MTTIFDDATRFAFNWRATGYKDPEVDVLNLIEQLVAAEFAAQEGMVSEDDRDDAVADAICEMESSFDEKVEERIAELSVDELTLLIDKVHRREVQRARENERAIADSRVEAARKELQVTPTQVLAEAQGFPPLKPKRARKSRAKKTITCAGDCHGPCAFHKETTP